MENAEAQNIVITCIRFALLMGQLCDMALRWYLKREDLPRTAMITMTITTMFLCLHGFSFYTLRCILLCQVLIVAGVCDWATYEIPDVLHIFIAMVGLIGLQPLSALWGTLLVPLPFLTAAVKTGKIGGGDVKLMAASGFAIGVTKGLWMMVWGLCFGILWNRVYGKGEKRIPLAPFLVAGCLLTLI